MAKCAVCGNKVDSAWVWQPFGPDDDSVSFQMGGSHYRGFPAIKTCCACHDDIHAGKRVEFTYRKIRYQFQRGMRMPERMPEVVNA